ncbi:hypothetical protein tinsulaeT_13810 [Thalassotalea insulae]|uniref:Copper chaperone PCu(A)C n=1 Tax=Thalassotalea insulae TaxID=2056778 RepID=A0ABQ6GQ76_9GAMM|nr:copper chaperone PCu(A)C [Thalassotalea insulae]GLX78041.1 hypothetical protein tinsulaeT_13810 [Thalassotalea insulae]
MKNLTVNRFLLIAVLSLLTNALFVHQAVASEITVAQGYVRATIPGTKISSAYMEIANHGEQDAILVAATSGVSDRVEIHQHTMENGLMKMRQQKSLTIAAHDVVKLQPGGYHLMIFNLTDPLKADEKIALTLHFDNNEKLDVNLPVKSIVNQQQSKSHHHH